MKKIFYVSLSSENVLNNSFHREILQLLEKKEGGVRIYCWGDHYQKNEMRRTLVSGHFLQWMHDLKTIDPAERPDFIYINDYFLGGLLGLIIRKKWNKPLFLRCGSPWKYTLNSPIAFGKTMLLALLKPFVLKNCAKVVYNSRALVGETEDENQKCLANNCIIYNGVDLEMFKPMLTLQKKGVEKDRLNKLRLLAIGNINKEKGLIYLFEAVKRLNDLVTLTVVGDGPLLKKYQRDYPFVIFQGRVAHDDLPTIINAHDLLVHPSYVESFPNVVLEAMACGKAVIATNVFGIPEMIDDYKNGFLVTPRDATAIENILREISNDQTILRRIGDNARKTTEERFNQKVQLEKLYQHFFS